jgi:hypothetical protein
MACHRRRGRFQDSGGKTAPARVGHGNGATVTRREEYGQAVGHQHSQHGACLPADSGIAPRRVPRRTRQQRRVRVQHLNSMDLLEPQRLLRQMVGLAQLAPITAHRLGVIAYVTSQVE